MKLKSLELYGFKSFAEKSKLVFEKDVAAIVGPNGSGKSNISDAVRWVLGEQSAKSLRGNNMQDVIFSGTDTKNQMNMASVSLTLDNRDKALNLDFDEVNITRKVFRTGESEYLLNKSSVRLKDIKELFLDTGIGKDGYSIIGQGRIDDILSSKSEDRRYIFEEASGISKFKYKKNEAEKKLAKNEESLTKIKSELKVKEQEVAILETQANNAKEGVKLTNELEKLELSLLQSNLEKIKADIIKLNAEKELAEVELREKNSRLSYLNESIQPFEDNIDNLKSEIESIRNEAIRKDRLVAKAQSDKDLLEEKIRFLEADIKRIEGEIAARDESFKANEKKLIEAKNTLKENRTERDLLDKKIMDNSAGNKSLKENKVILEKDISNIGAEVKTISDRLASLNIDRHTKENIGKVNDIKKAEYSLSLQESIKGLKEYKNTLSSKEKKLDEVNGQIEKNSENIIQLVDEREKFQTDIKATNEDISVLNNEYYKIKSERDIMMSLYKSYEGYYKPIQNLLKARDVDEHVASRIFGVMADLIEVDKEYKQAVDVTLGPALQNIVVEDEEDGKYLINYIKKNNLGRITFLPISKIKGNRYDIKHPLVIDTLNNLIKYDPKISGIIDHFLSRTALVNNMEDAVKVSKDISGVRIVTIDGDIINSWGSMVGGNFYKKESNSLLNRKAQIDQLDKELKAVIKKGKGLRDLLNSKEASYNEIINKLSSLDLNNSSLSNEKNNILTDIKECKVKIDFENKTIEDINKAIRELNSESMEVDFSSIEELEGKLLSREKDLEEKNILLKDVSDKLIEAEKAHIKFETQYEVLVRDISNLENQIELISQDNDDILSLNRKEVDKKLSLQNQVVDYRAQLDKIEPILKDAGLDSKADETKLNELITKLNVAEDSIKKDRFEQDKLREEVNNLDKVIFQLNLKLSSTEEKEGELIAIHSENYDIAEDVILKKLQNLDPVKTTRKEILLVKNKLSQIGFFNFASIEQYNIELENLEFLRNQYEDLVKSKEDIEKLIKKLEMDMTRLFKESFDKINIKFGEVFKILFDGGDAQLILEGDDVLTADIDIIAKPPGKKLKNLGLLSGGEKALTAVALLFAIFEINPAPFCILDEIDAALDEANIKRYLYYLRGMTDRTQFIIITHRKVTMEMADILYGVTMEDKGVSKLITLELDDYKEI